MKILNNKIKMINLKTEKILPLIPLNLLLLIIKIKIIMICTPPPEKTNNNSQISNLQGP